MSYNQDDELLLAREVQLVYSNVQGFSMEGSVRTWRGTIRTGAPIDENFVFEIFIPNLFPESPPVVRAITPMKHHSVNRDGFVSLQILHRWRREFHLYQVMLQLISLMKRDPPVKEKHGYTQPQNIVQPTQSTRNYSQPSNYSPQPANNQQQRHEIASLKKQMDQLKGEITKRDEELTRVRARDAIDVTEIKEGPFKTSFKHLKSNDQIAELESEQIAISELMASLHEKYTTGEVSIFDYSKLYKKYSRDLYILNKKLEYVKSTL